MRVWLNGSIVDAAMAAVSPFDRGFLFGDGVYEAIQFFNRVGVGFDLHVERLRRSLERTRIGGFDLGEVAHICVALLEDLGSANAIIYLQVTRGTEIPRRHVPGRELAATVFAYALPTGGLSGDTPMKSVRCVVRPDDRWSHCSIKSLNLLPNVLGLLDAHEHDAAEVIFERDGWVTAGAMTSVFCVADDVLVTPPLGGKPSILPGVTRAMLLEEAKVAGWEVAERPLPVSELRAANEVFIASTRRLIDAVVGIDDVRIGHGVVGDRTRLLFDLIRARVASDCGVTLHSRV